MKSGIRRFSKRPQTSRNAKKVPVSPPGKGDVQANSDIVAPPSFSQIQLTIPVRGGVTQQRIEEKLEDYQKLHAPKRTLTQTDALQWDDEICVDLLGYVDGELYLNQTDTWMHLRSNHDLPGLFEALIDTPLEKPIMVRTTFPTEFADSGVAGKEMVCAILVKGAHRRETSKLAADWWTMLEMGDTLESVHKHIEAELEEELACELTLEAKERALDELYENHASDISDEQIEAFLHQAWEREEKHHYVNLGASLLEQEQAKQLYCQSPAQHQRAKKAIWTDAFLMQTAHRLKIQVSKEEVMNVLCQAGRSLGLRALTIHDELGKDATTFQRLAENLRKEKALDAILSQIRVTYEVEALAA